MDFYDIVGLDRVRCGESGMAWSQPQESNEADEGLKWANGHDTGEGELESRAIWREGGMGNRRVPDAWQHPVFPQGREICLLASACQIGGSSVKSRL